MSNWLLPGQTIDDSALFSLPVLYPQLAQRNKDFLCCTLLNILENILIIHLKDGKFANFALTVRDIISFNSDKLPSVPLPAVLCY